MSRSEALPGWESFLEEAMRKQELDVGLGWGVGRGSNLEDRDYAESPPKAPSLLVKRVKKQGTRERVPSSRSPKQAGRQAGLAALYGPLGTPSSSRIPGHVTQPFCALHAKKRKSVSWEWYPNTRMGPQDSVE